MKLQIKVIDEALLPSAAPVGMILILRDQDRAYAGNGGEHIISEITDIVFVNNQAELLQQAKVKNTFYVVRYDEAQNTSTSLYMWNGTHDQLFATDNDTTIFAYLINNTNPSDASEYVSKTEFNNTVGNLNDLQTESKDNLVNSINKVNTKTSNDGGTF